MSHFDAMIEGHVDLPTLHAGDATPQEEKIGQLIAENLVSDGATLQMGEKYCLLLDVIIFR